jgi:hypothetical protein
LSEAGDQSADEFPLADEDDSMEPKLAKSFQQLTRHFKHQAVQLSN